MVVIVIMALLSPNIPCFYYLMTHPEIMLNK